GKDTFISKKSRPWIVADFPTKLALLADGFGWGFMPEHMVRDALKRRALKHLKLTEEFMRRLFEIPAGAPIDNTVTVYAARRFDLPAGPVATSMWQIFQRLKD